MVSYKIVDKDGNTIINKPKQACFTGLWTDAGKEKCRGLENSLIYKPDISKNFDKELTIKWIDNLREIGFHVPQTAEEVLKDGYRVCFKDIARKKGVVLSELGANLTLIRYLEEFTDHIKNYFKLLELDPTLDKWTALQLVHTSAFPGPHWGEGHNLIPEMGFGDRHPLISWNHVQSNLNKSNNIWDGNNTFHMYSHYARIFHPIEFAEASSKLPTIETKNHIKKAIELLHDKT